MRTALAVLLVLHGIAHLPGFINSWRLAELEGMPYRTTVLSGRVDLGHWGIRAAGLVWLLLAVAFAGTPAAALLQRPAWVAAALGASLLSLALSALEWPEARIGVALNLALAAGLAWALRAGWS
jgi:hypothetical protein